MPAVESTEKYEEPRHQLTSPSIDGLDKADDRHVQTVAIVGFFAILLWLTCSSVHAIQRANSGDHKSPVRETHCAEQFGDGIPHGTSDP